MRFDPDPLDPADSAKLTNFARFFSRGCKIFALAE
jgi:hypothetical protein